MDNYKIEEWCESLKGAEKEFKVEWNALLYKVGGKMFALIGHDGEGEEVISLKNLPEYNIELRERFSDIIPGYYLNKAHWNSVKLAGKVPEALMQELIIKSYECVFNSLTKKQRETILG